MKQKTQQLNQLDNCLYIGIDPGLNGGIAVLNGNGDYVMCDDMPRTSKEIDVGSFTNLVNLHDLRLVVIEQVHSMPKQGVSSSFTFGKGYGMLIGAMTALKIPWISVTPQAWKKLILAGTTKDKDAAINYCLRRYPDVNLIPEGKRTYHDGMADALCIATYAFMTQNKVDNELSTVG